MKKLVREWEVVPGVGSYFRECGKVPTFDECESSKLRVVPKVRFETMPKKPSKKLPLEREWLAFDPELDKKYYWANVLTMENGKVKVTQELREVK